MPVVLTIAGSDSSGGAGIQADLKTFAALEVFGVSAITAVTSQNTSGVHEVYPLPSSVVRSQIYAVAADMSIASVKTGMLATADTVVAVADAIETLRLPFLVLDPVMRAGARAGRTLLEPDAVQLLKSRLLPLAAVVTPNIAETRTLTDIEVASVATARDAARKLVDMGARAAIVKGGHLDGPTSVDVLYDGRGFVELAAPRDAGGPVHGTGCTFASAIAARLALGDDVESAARRAKEYVTGAILHATREGAGARLAAHFWNYTQ